MDISEFVKTISAENSSPGLGTEYYYRGHSNKDYKLTPSIYRNEELINNEHNIFRQAIVNNPHDFSNCKTTIENLVKMQHYDIPTRLLDVTSNALVALYFACDKCPKQNGEVITFKIYDNNIKYYDSDTISILANVSKIRPDYVFEQEITSKSEFSGTQGVGFLLHEIKKEIPHFQNEINPNDTKSVFLVKTKLDNQRIQKQSGAFLIFGFIDDKTNSATIPKSWILNRILIPAEDKRKIIEELNNFGINENTLFPEITSQGDFLRKRYERPILN